MRRWFVTVWLIAGLLIGLASLGLAQTVTTTVSGYVTDATTGKPMPFASVYLNGSTRGTLTDEKGSFSLTGIPLGTAELVASFVGYQPDKHLFRFDNADAKRANFRLKPNDQTLTTVTVRANLKKYQQHLRQFKRQLLGEPFGGQCQILNEDVLHFKEADGHLTATATEAIVIENQALGYKIWYDLLHFDGTSQKVYYAGTARFEEMKAENERQANRFQRNRMTAYKGSTRHLMASLVDSTYGREGFLVYQENITVPIDRSQGMRPSLAESINRRLKPLRIKTLIQPGRLAFERRLVSALPLVIFYTGATSSYSPYVDARYAYSQLTLPAGQLQLTVDGTITMPQGMEIQGSLADDRLSRLLPDDWQPNQANADPATTAPIVTQGKLLPADARLGRIATAFTDRFRALAPVLFVHTDKPFYATGDRLWLSAYLLDAATNRRPLGETAIHVDVLAPTGRLVQHQWLRVDDGRAVGNFRLSDSLASGTYRLRAYTDEDDRQKRPAFERSITVYNLVSNSAPPNDTSEKSLDVQLLPEGGRWVVGVPAQLGVKIIGPDGHGRAAAGRIVDDRGIELSQLTTNALGMGRVVLTPQAGRTYYAEVVNVNQKQRVPLPPAAPDGLMLSVDVLSDSTRLGLTIMGTHRPAVDSAYVLIQQQGRLVGQQKIQLQNGVTKVSLSTATLPAGLNQVTVYDAAARPQAERLVFVPDKLPPIRVIIGLNKSRYQPREQAVLNFTLNNDGLPAVAVLSASITDAEQVPADTAEATLQTHLLLTGELRGRVEHPNVYLSHPTPETRRALDDLLLTQGWRRVSGTPATELLGGVSLMGRILNPANRPIAGAQFVVASTVPGQSFVKSAGADEQGRFRLAGLVIADTVQLMTQLTNHQLKDIPDKDAHFVLEGPGVSWERDTTNHLPNWAALKAQLAAASIRQESDSEFYRDKTVTLLKEVIVRAKKYDERPDDIRQRSLHSGADATLLFDEKSPPFNNLYEMMRGRAAGVSITNTPAGGYRVIIRGMGSLQSGNQPLYLLDGMPIQDDDGTALLNFNPGDIERIEVLKNGGTAGIYGVRGGNGVIAFYTRRFRPDQVQNGKKAGMKSLQLIGYPSVQREFYAPRYELKPDEASTASSRIDRRDVLYWKPIIQTDSQGRSQLLFPLSDVVRTVRVTVQGITTEGRPVVATQLFRVQ